MKWQGKVRSERVTPGLVSKDLRKFEDYLNGVEMRRRLLDSHLFDACACEHDLRWQDRAKSGMARAGLAVKTLKSHHRVKSLEVKDFAVEWRIQHWTAS